VSYEEVLLDGTNDVFVLQTEQPVMLPSIDIISLTSSASAGVLNITLNLMDELNVSAVYEGFFDVDDSVHFQVQWSQRGFSAYAPGHPDIVVTGSLAPDDRSISWEILLTEVGATSSFSLVLARTRLLTGTGLEWVDVAFVEEGPVDERMDLEVRYSVLDINTIERRFKMSYVDEMAVAYRRIIDTDGDGMVTTQEVANYTQARKSFGDLRETQISRNDEDPSSATLTVTVVGAEGPVTSTTLFVEESRLSIAWPADEAKRAVFAWNGELQFRSFEYWDLKDTSSFTLEMLVADPTSKLGFNLSQIPPAEEPFWTSSKKAYIMTGPQMASSWNQTMAARGSFTVELPDAAGDTDGSDDGSGEDVWDWFFDAPMKGLCGVVAVVCTLLAIYVFFLMKKKP
jgi:hypothetical protein